MDMVGWLRRLGLGRYEAAFRDNEIDETVLPNLTAEDLKDLGVSLVGHRRKLLDAIAALRTDASTKALSSDAATASSAPTVSLEDRAERRQVTVMFSDLVGSTALSARMDPEDLRELISAYQKCVAETVRRFGGFVGQYLGDGVLVYFGYPEAHEDDAERAVRAGLEMIAAVIALKTPASLQTRIGIATGLVVVGDLTGQAQERGIVGETPNLAARLQGIAEPNTVVIGEGTRKLLGTLFEFEDIGPKYLKGMTKPVRAWAALRASSVKSRFEALRAAGLTALVGRDEEFELLLRRWSRAKSGEGQVVLLSGEAGIGKSRLTAALVERLATELHTCLRFFCSPQHTDSALYPVIGHVERAAGFAHDDTPQARLDKLDALLVRTSSTAQDAALFAEMLSLPNDGRYPILALSPEQRRQRTLGALIAEMQALSRKNPVLMILEDAHWTDPTSLEAFGQVVDRLRTLPVLLIVTCRPEFEPPWIGCPYSTALTVNRLAQRDIEAMINDVVGNRRLRANVRQDIIERTDGIPLFVEEMTKAVLEAESEGAAERTVAAVPSPAQAVPASLYASLMARLDRLGSASKEIAQIGAVIGREFSHDLLVAVARKPETELNSSLDRLIEGGLLFRQGVLPHATYLFKHALVQDAAYGTLLREPKRALHARVAKAIESQFAEIAERQPELLARHCAEAGQMEKSAGLWSKAGQRSLGRSALVEATEQLTRALDQIAVLPETPALRREMVKLQVALANALMHVKGYAAPETKAALERAHLLTEQAVARGEPSEDPLLLFSLLYGFWVTNTVALNGNVALDLATQFLALAQKQSAVAPLMVGYRLMGSSLLYTGDVGNARLQLDKANALYDPVRHRQLATRFGQDIRVAILSWRSLALWLLGYPDTALADVDQAVSNAREISQAATLIYALIITPITALHCGSFAVASAQLEEGIALADEKSTLFFKAGGSCLQGCILALSGEAASSVGLITSGLEAWRATGATLFVPLYLSNLAIAYAALGRSDEARRCIDEAICTIATTEGRWFEAEANRIAGEIALKSPEPDAGEAERYFERALAIARKQEAKSWELRAAMSMARLWCDQGSRQQARGLLTSVYGWFSEGFATRDLKDAKALLEELQRA